MVRIRVALAFTVATCVALFGFAAPAQAANSGHHYGQLATHVNNGHHYGHLKKTAPPAPTPPPPSGRSTRDERLDMDVAARTTAWLVYRPR